MSQYLIDQIAATPNIRLRPRTDLERVEGNGHVERVVLRPAAGRHGTEDADAVFIFIGTRPQSDWLPDGVLRDGKGFVLTGRDLMAAERFAAGMEGSTRTAAARNERPRRVRGRATSAPAP